MLYIALKFLEYSNLGEKHWRTLNLMKKIIKEMQKEKLKFIFKDVI